MPLFLRRLLAYNKQCQVVDATRRDAFRVKAKLRKQAAKRKRKRQKQLAEQKRKLQRRLDKEKNDQDRGRVFSPGKILYEISKKNKGIGGGGIAMIHAMQKRLGLADAIDRRVHVLKFHRPYHESDHVLNIALNCLLGGTCLDDIELRRNDENYLNLLGAARIPDPTTAGDFCRRFNEHDIHRLQRAFDEARLQAWRRQPDAFFEEAVVDFDGTLTETDGECKEGMEYSYKKIWGYHPLLASLANTAEPLRIVNRPGNRPSHEGAAATADDVVQLLRAGGFRKILLRGDTDFSQTRHLDRWHEQGDVSFVFGYDKTTNLQATADGLAAADWRELQRREKRPVKTQPRRRPDNVKEQIVVERQFENISLEKEEVAEFDYQPAHCHRSYRMVVVKKYLVHERGQQFLFADEKYFFYLTNKRDISAEQVVFLANDRCDQENLIEQLKNGVRSLHAPVDNLHSNWAYMVIASLAWSLKAWAALLLPEEPGRWQARHREQKRRVLRMHFKTFVNYFIQIPCQVVRTGRRTVLRVMNWNPWQAVFFRLADVLHC